MLYLEYTKEDILKAQKINIDLKDVLSLNFNLLKDKNIKTKFENTTLISNGDSDVYVDMNGSACFSDFGFIGVARLESQRLTLFKEKGTVCACCGLEASFFRKDVGLSSKAIRNLTEPYKGTFHLNLYGIRDGEEVLFTKDHILAKSNGGRNNFQNYATMCTQCNRLKGSYKLSLHEFKKLYAENNTEKLKEILVKFYK